MIAPTKDPITPAVPETRGSRRERRGLRWGARGAALMIAVGLVGITAISQYEAHDLITNPRATRRMPADTPADRQLRYEDVTVTTADGLRLVAWYIPGTNGATVMLLHGYKDQRGLMLDVATVLARHGYGVFIGAMRAHDRSDGEKITFGHLEVLDVGAWERHLRARLDLDPDRIGIFGYSMGGSVAIQYAAQSRHIKAVVADSAFSSINDTVNTSVKFFTGLPPFPFAPMIVFWSEREGGYRASAVDASACIARISPRPVLLMQGGKDVIISPDSGQKLLAAAGEPKELWFDPAIGHIEFFSKHPEEFERRLVAFYDKYLARK
jgi:fermentation-respiration switch protein FrsA (DUF1100 family)